MEVIIRLTGRVFVTMILTDRDMATICRDAGGQAPLPQFAQITWFLARFSPEKARSAMSSCGFASRECRTCMTNISATLPATGIFHSILLHYSHDTQSLQFRTAKYSTNSGSLFRTAHESHLQQYTATMSCGDIFLGLIAVLFPPVAGKSNRNIASPNHNSEATH